MEYILLEPKNITVVDLNSNNEIDFTEEEKNMIAKTFQKQLIFQMSQKEY